MDRGIGAAKEVPRAGEYDLVVLDEINVALFFGLVKWPDLKAFGRPPLGDRSGADRPGRQRRLIRKANLVTGNEGNQALLLMTWAWRPAWALKIKKDA